MHAFAHLAPRILARADARDQRSCSNASLADGLTRRAGRTFRAFNFLRAFRASFGRGELQKSVAHQAKIQFDLVVVHRLYHHAAVHR